MMTFDGLKDFDLVLASASPRRRQLLEDAGLTFTTAVAQYDEVWPDGLSGREIAEHLAAAKARAWNEPIRERQIVITADTVVWCRGRLLGKPADSREAAHFLRLLSDCEHEVTTAICLRDSRRSHTFSVTTRVMFRMLQEDEITYYVERFAPLDKAGAYGIQEWIGLRGITRIEGSYYNVVGMPVSDLLTELIRFTGNNTD
ncbi:MAG: Maf family nucleotide pyrophosphatase [Bacteroidales bacterium]|nr:Maf family nucleotide pyrophosphatase [Bacteroidales bacterium]MDT8372515.1 Maf family nucleotide pyrophosphatase [Bacteroidales bacterium]